MNGLLLWHCIIHIPWPTPMTAVVPMEPQSVFFFNSFFFLILLSFLAPYSCISTCNREFSPRVPSSRSRFSFIFNKSCNINSIHTRTVQKVETSSKPIRGNHHLPIIISYRYLLIRKLCPCLNNNDKLSNPTCKSNQVSDISTELNGGRSVTNRPSAAAAVSLRAGKFGRRVIDRGPPYTCAQRR